MALLDESRLGVVNVAGVIRLGGTLTGIVGVILVSFYDPVEGSTPFSRHLSGVCGSRL